MGKPKPSQGSNKKPKSSVKINNKKQNKANKSKKVNKKLRKALTKVIYIFSDKFLIILVFDI